MEEVQNYRCLSCNGVLRFDPPSQEWNCDYCKSSFNKSQIDSEYTNTNSEGSIDDLNELNSYNCSSCGAELITDNTTSATFCVFCKNSSIIKQRFSGKFKPRSLIPFKIDKNSAEQIYKAYIKKKFFAPTIFKKKEEIDKITGIYAPFWLFDCRTKGLLDGEGRKITTWSSGDYRYKKTKYYEVQRAATAEYDNIPVDASTKLDDDLMNMIEPFNYSDLKDFNMQYLSGFMAERYDVSSKVSQGLMKQKVNDFMANRLKETISGYTSYQTSGIKIDLENITDEYSLLPIYLLVNKFRNKEYIAIINGQTGKVVGNVPNDFKKQILFTVLMFIVILILCFIGGGFFV